MYIPISGPMYLLVLINTHCTSHCTHHIFLIVMKIPYLYICCGVNEFIIDPHFIYHPGVSLIGARVPVSGTNYFVVVDIQMVFISEVLKSCNI